MAKIKGSGHKLTYRQTRKCIAVFLLFYVLIVKACCACIINTMQIYVPFLKNQNYYQSFLGYLVYVLISTVHAAAAFAYFVSSLGDVV